MLFSTPERYQCPHCRKVKKLPNHYWNHRTREIVRSDTAMTYAKGPERWEVQRCPFCGNYFFLQDARKLPSQRNIREERLQKAIMNGMADMDADTKPNGLRRIRQIILNKIRQQIWYRVTDSLWVNRIYKTHTGTLSLSESIEALNKLYDKSDDSRKNLLRQYVLYAYNNQFARETGNQATEN